MQNGSWEYSVLASFPSAPYLFNTYLIDTLASIKRVQIYILYNFSSHLPMSRWFAEFSKNCKIPTKTYVYSCLVCDMTEKTWLLQKSECL